MEIAIVVLTSALVCVTGYYAWQTRQTVQELRRARGVAILPRVTLSADFPGPTFMWVVLSNQGLGPAIDVDLVVTFEPDGGTVRWSAPLMVAGERRRLRPPAALQDPTAMEPSARVVLRGTYEDAIGDRHDVDEAFSPKTHWDTLVEANTARDVDALKEIKDELEKIRRAMEHRNAYS